MDNATLNLLSPGQRLRAEREQRGLQVDDVAQRMRLTPAVIQKLENDEFDGFVSLTYALGYVRNYARILQLDADEMVEQILDAFPHFDGGPVERSLLQTARAQVQAQSRSLMLTNWLIGALLVLVIFWYHGNYLSPSLKEDERIAEAMPLPEVMPPPEPAPKQGATVPQAETGMPESAVEDPAVDDLLVLDADAGVGVDADDTVLTAWMETAQGRFAGEVADDGTGFESMAGSVDRVLDSWEDTFVSRRLEPGPDPMRSSPERAEERAENETRGNGRVWHSLRLEFITMSWVDIADADGEYLLYRLGRPGQTVEMRGLAPLRIRIGNPRGVRLYHDDELVDLLPHAEANKGVANFVLE